MSLFVDNYFSPFNNNPFGLDDFHSTSFSGFRSGPNFSLFGQNQEEQEQFHPFRMKLRNGSLLTDSGFYDHFDSIFHDRSKRYDLRAATSDSSRRSQQSTAKAKEYIIPIKIETSRKGESQSSKKLGSASTSSGASKTSPSKDSSGQVIEIPVHVERGSPSENGKPTRLRDKSRSPLLTQNRQPTAFKLLIPTTDDKRNSPKRDSSKDVVLDSDSFFTKIQRDPPKLGKPESDIEVVEIDDEVSVIGGSLRRKPLRHQQKTAPAASSQASVSALKHSLLRAEKCDQKPTSSADGRVCENKEIGSGSQEETEGKRSSCCSPGHIDITAPPSYPIYDYLKPELLSQSRQIDYIRGDGNCFFRAISKDVYGSEEFHAECRQAVCDLIQGRPDLLRQYIDHGSVDAHVSDMRLPATWATTCEIYAGATLLGRDIYVLAPAPGDGTRYHWLLFSPRCLPGDGTGGSSTTTTTMKTAGGGGGGAAAASLGGGTGSKSGPCEEEEGGRRVGGAAGRGPCYVTLCHTNANHYDRITPIGGGCNCQLAPPSLSGVSVNLDLTS